MPKEYGQACPVARSLAFLGERWTLLIIRDLLRGPKKFQELGESLSGVAPGVLSRRLKDLEVFGIVQRNVYVDHPPRAEYTLTEKGRDLRPIVASLAVWGARHMPGGRVLRHRDCEHPIEMAYYCSQCQKTISGEQVTFQRDDGDRRESRSPRARGARSRQGRSSSRSARGASRT
jgi:DNA-binding HxlR family transcriptional regulator